RLRWAEITDCADTQDDEEENMEDEKTEDADTPDEADIDIEPDFDAVPDTMPEPKPTLEDRVQWFVEGIEEWDAMAYDTDLHGRRLWDGDKFGLDLEIKDGTTIDARFRDELVATITVTPGEDGPAASVRPADSTYITDAQGLLGWLPDEWTAALEGEATGEQLRRLRKEAGLLQSAVADEVGITQGRLSEYESGERSPTADMLERLAKVLGPITIY
ncbi:MAG: helix-turn-helix domain-containing protein, partial [Persicimonas sp.]